jgi:hypothetical protein
MVHWSSRTSFYPRDTPPYHTHLIKVWPGVSVAGLRPVHFPRQQPRPVSCYTLFKGWLLLSLPPGCLWLVTKFSSLSQHLRTLTPVCVVPLLDIELTPMPPLPSSMPLEDSEFDSAPRPLDPCVRNQCSTLPAGSDEAELRLISGGTSYRRT